MLQLVVNGLAFGCIYALVALGFVLIYNAVNSVNFAQGDMAMIGAYVGVALVTGLGLPLAAGYVLVVLCMIVLGYVFTRTAYYPLRDKPLETVIISTLGVGIVLRNAARIAFGPFPASLPSFFGDETIDIGSASLVPQNLFIIGVTLLLVLLQSWFFSHTFTGRMMQATAQDRDAARLMGIPVTRMLTFTFIWATVLAGVAGLLLGPIFFVSADMGTAVILKAFAASIVGGFGSLPGAIVGGIFIGLVENFGAAYLSTAYKDVFSFVVLIGVLFFFSRGFFGEKIAEKV